MRCCFLCKPKPMFETISFHLTPQLTCWISHDHRTTTLTQRGFSSCIPVQLNQWKLWFNWSRAGWRGSLREQDGLPLLHLRRQMHPRSEVWNCLIKSVPSQRDLRQASIMALYFFFFSGSWMQTGHKRSVFLHQLCEKGRNPKFDDWQLYRGTEGCQSLQ